MPINTNTKINDDDYDANGILKDGRSVKVPMQFMDSMQRSVVFQDGYKFLDAARKNAEQASTADPRQDNTNSLRCALFGRSGGISRRHGCCQPDKSHLITSFTIGPRA